VDLYRAISRISDGHFENPAGSKAWTSEGDTPRHKKSNKRGQKYDDKNNPTENVFQMRAGHVDLKNGVATLQIVRFPLPGPKPWCRALSSVE